MKRIIQGIAITLLAACSFSLAGCNTVHGAGKDIEKGGEKIQSTADRNK